MGHLILPLAPLSLFILQPDPQRTVSFRSPCKTNFNPLGFLLDHLRFPILLKEDTSSPPPLLPSPHRLDVCGPFPIPPPRLTPLINPPFFQVLFCELCQVLLLSQLSPFFWAPVWVFPTYPLFPIVILCLLISGLPPFQAALHGCFPFSVPWARHPKKLSVARLPFFPPGAVTLCPFIFSLFFFATKIGSTVSSFIIRFLFFLPFPLFFQVMCNKLFKRRSGRAEESPPLQSNWYDFFSFHSFQ